MSRPIFRKGIDGELPQFAGEDELFFVEDTMRIYKGMGPSTPLISFSDVVGGFTNYEDLCSKDPALTNKIYLTDDGVLSIYVGGRYEIIADIKDKHIHTNIEVLDKLGIDASGNLLFDGKPITSVPATAKGVVNAQPLEYGMYTLSTNISNVDANTTVPFDVHSGNLQMVDGKVTLKAGHIYNISTNMQTAAPGTSVYYHIYDHTNNVIINPRSSFLQATGTSDNGGMELIIEPTSDIQVSLRSQTQATTIYWAYSALIIKELPQSIATVVSDIGMTENKMTVTYSDSTTKELTIQGGGSGAAGVHLSSREW